MAIITRVQSEAILAKYRPDISQSGTQAVEDAHLEWASSVLDTYNWVGARTVSTQANSWPRSAVPVDRFDSSLGVRDSSLIPDEIQLIVAELAIRFQLNPSLLEDSSKAIGLTGLTLPDTIYEVLGDNLKRAIQPYLRYPAGTLYRQN